MVEDRSRLDGAHVRLAVAALLKHVKSSGSGKQSLLENEGEIILAQVSLHKIPGKVSAKPIRIPIPHPLRQREDCDMCLFVKDSAKKALKEKLEKDPVQSLSKVIELQKLRTQYHQFKDRRALLSQYDLFLCDDRILPMLTKALGKTFMDVKKQPVPVRLEQHSSLGTQIDRARDSAFLVGSYGDCWAVKLAHTAMTVEEVSANLMAGIAAVVHKIPAKWKNVKTINIKCSNSVALPIYSNIGDLPPAPPVATTTSVKTRDNVVDEGDGLVQKAGGKPEGGKTRKPRPLIRQQLNKWKEEAKAEKPATEPKKGKDVAKGSSGGAGGGKVKGSAKSPAEITAASSKLKRSKEGAGKSVETVDADVAGSGKAERKVSGKAGKRQSPNSAATKGDVGKAKKRRRAEVV